ncbi:DUF5895 domain-containing protein [Alkalinema pantanalense CENA528]|uniref:DUF5895 domain-containing protein n=1 Tax=Alkalinema pantanalense TaxID=1620705 RepID=UPI003D700D42
MVKPTNARNSSPSTLRTGAKTATSKAQKSTTATGSRAVRSDTTGLDGFEVDPDLLSDAYNQVRRPLLPYGIVVNDKPAGILIPIEQLEKAGWIVMPDEDDLTTVTFTEEVTGLLITDARLLVLAFVPEYIRYKSDVEDLGGTVVGLYDEYRHSLDKKAMDVCSEHALLFLDEDNQPLHTCPIVVRFKNVALWSFKSAREEFYRSLEKTFADYCNVPFSGKNDKWRSLGVLEVEFKAVKEGEGKNKHDCCKTVAYTKPTIETLPLLYLGTSTAKALIWQQHDAIAGFTEPQSLPALPGEVEAVEVEVLPPHKNGVTGRALYTKEISRNKSTQQQVESGCPIWVNLDCAANEFQFHASLILRVRFL